MALSDRPVFSHILFNLPRLRKWAREKVHRQSNMSQDSGKISQILRYFDNFDKPSHCMIVVCNCNTIGGSWGVWYKVSLCRERDSFLLVWEKVRGWAFSRCSAPWGSAGSGTASYNRIAHRGLQFIIIIIVVIIIISDMEAWKGRLSSMASALFYNTPKYCLVFYTIRFHQIWLKKLICLFVHILSIAAPIR